MFEILTIWPWDHENHVVISSKMAFAGTMLLAECHQIMFKAELLLWSFLHQISWILLYSLGFSRQISEKMTPGEAPLWTRFGDIRQIGMYFLGDSSHIWLNKFIDLSTLSMKVYKFKLSVFFSLEMYVPRFKFDSYLKSEMYLFK